MKKPFLFLFIIVCVSLFLRTYRVSSIPPALSWDEVSIGYNAYSILKTGKDEHGRFLPLDTFVAYGDYKPPLAIYITVPFVAIFGLNELAVRLPSVLFGTLTVLLTYFLAKELFFKSQIPMTNDQLGKKSFIGNWILDIGNSKNIALLSAMLLAISPWHINLSRAGFEATIALFFIVLGAVLCLAARQKEKLFWICWLPFVAAVYTFNSARYFVPFLALGLIIYCWKYIIRQWRNMVIGVVVAAIGLLPILPHLVSKEARLRFVEVNIFSDLRIIEQANERIAFDNYSIVGNIFHNRRVGFIRSFFVHYFDNFSPEFLFIKGDGNPKFSTQDVGQLYIVDLPFLLLGLIMMFTYFRAQAWLLSYWLLTAIIPAATARETPHALRILNSLPTWHIFIAFGIMSVFQYVVHHRNRIVYCLSLIVLYLASISYYLYGYYVHYPRLYSNEWQYGYKQALEYIEKHKSTYDKIYLTESIGRAYMYTLFYTRFDPDKFLKLKKSYFDAAGFYHVEGFDKYVFSDTVPTAFEPASLYIFPSSQTPKGVIMRENIRLLNGEPALTIFEKG